MAIDMRDIQVGRHVVFVLSDGSGYEHVGTITDLFVNPADGLYVSTDHIADLSVTVDEIVRVLP